MPVKRTVKEEFERIMNGMVYHMRDLTDLMVQNATDPFFKTELGVHCVDASLRMTMAHATILMKLMMEEKDEEYKKQDSIELSELLKQCGLSNDEEA